VATQRELDIIDARMKHADELGRTTIEVRTSAGAVGTIHRRVGSKGHVSINGARVFVHDLGGSAHVLLASDALPDDLDTRGY
jgi:UDP-N-acetylglucosamine enolpyruvyl transferase